MKIVKWTQPKEQLGPTIHQMIQIKPNTNQYNPVNETEESGLPEEPKDLTLGRLETNDIGHKVEC